MENNVNQTEDSGASPFLPVLLVALSVLLFVSWQFYNVWKQQSGLKDIQKSRTQLVNDSQRVQGELQNLAMGLLEVARAGDPDAVALVQRFGISQSQPPQAPK